MSPDEVTKKIQETKAFFEQLKTDAHDYDLLTWEDDIIDLCDKIVEKINETW